MASAQKLLDKLPDTVTGRLPKGMIDRVEKSVVGVVRLHGVISPAMSPMARSVLNIAAVEPVLTRAFESDKLAAVAIVINSPGGAPTQSALIADKIRGLAEEHEVPVIAFCEDVAASGGYWLACAADEIYAHPTSIVGSIGVISGGFGLTGLIDKLGVERRLHTAGRSKSRLDPFLPEKPDDVAWLTGLQTELHRQFQEWVRARRGDKLVGTDEELFTGEVWTGAAARDLGLVDGVGTLREVLAERFPDAEPTSVEGRKPLLARLGLAGISDLARPRPMAGVGLVEELLSVAENRAAWARFGL